MGSRANDIRIAHRQNLAILSPHEAAEFSEFKTDTDVSVGGGK
jgi:hypothetical protein